MNLYLYIRLSIIDREIIRSVKVKFLSTKMSLRGLDVLWGVGWGVSSYPRAPARKDSRGKLRRKSVSIQETGCVQEIENFLLTFGSFFFSFQNSFTLPRLLYFDSRSEGSVFAFALRGMADRGGGTPPQDQLMAAILLGDVT